MLTVRFDENICSYPNLTVLKDKKWQTVEPEENSDEYLLLSANKYGTSIVNYNCSKKIYNMSINSINYDLPVTNHRLAVYLEILGADDNDDIILKALCARYDKDNKISNIQCNKAKG